MAAKDELGRRGEDVAAEWFARRGFVVLERNWRCAAGELDLIVRGDGVTVVTITDPELSTAVMAIDLAIRLGNRSNEAAAILARREGETPL